jgi:hypothetical protein
MDGRKYHDATSVGKSSFQQLSSFVCVQKECVDMHFTIAGLTFKEYGICNKPDVMKDDYILNIILTMSTQPNMTKQ